MCFVFNVVIVFCVVILSVVVFLCSVFVFFCFVSVRVFRVILFGDFFEYVTRVVFDVMFRFIIFCFVYSVLIVFNCVFMFFFL